MASRKNSTRLERVDEYGDTLGRNDFLVDARFLYLVLARYVNSRGGVLEVTAKRRRQRLLRAERKTSVWMRCESAKNRSPVNLQEKHWNWWRHRASSDAADEIFFSPHFTLLRLTFEFRSYFSSFWPCPDGRLFLIIIVSLSPHSDFSFRLRRLFLIAFLLWFCEVSPELHPPFSF